MMEAHLVQVNTTLTSQAKLWLLRQEEQLNGHIVKLRDMIILQKHITKEMLDLEAINPILHQKLKLAIQQFQGPISEDHHSVLKFRRKSKIQQ